MNRKSINLVFFRVLYKIQQIRTMSSRSKEKVTAVIRKFFKSSEKIENGDGNSGAGASGSGGPAGSPSRRLRR